MRARWVGLGWVGLVGMVWWDYAFVRKLGLLFHPKHGPKMVFF